MSSEIEAVPETSSISSNEGYQYTCINLHIVQSPTTYSRKAAGRLNASFSGNTRDLDKLKSTTSFDNSKKLGSLIRSTNFSDNTKELEELELINESLSKKSKSTPRKGKPRFEVKVLEKKNKKKLSYDLPMIPQYKDYQLLGDSQLVRFAEKILQEKISLTVNTRSRYIGFCKSGQRINDLRAQLAEYDYKVHSKVIVMIGTNDIMQNTDLQWMCSKYVDLLTNLLEKCDRIVLLTVPPIPKLENSKHHKHLLEHLNKFIKDQEDRKKIFVIDFYTCLVKLDKEIVLDFYEKTFYPGDRPDLVHINLRGLTLLKSALDTYYFSGPHLQ